MSAMLDFAAPLPFGGVLHGDDPYLSPLIPREQIFYEMTANEETSSDSVSSRQPFTSPDDYFIVEHLDDDNAFHGYQPDFSLEGTSTAAAASGASSLPEGGVPGSHFSSHQSTVMPGNRVEDVSASVSSLSPGTDPVIMTPSSGYTSYNQRYADGSDGSDNISPISPRSMMNGDFAAATGFPSISTGEPLIGRQFTILGTARPPHSPSAISGVSGLHHDSRASSIAPSSATHQEGMSQWGTFYAPTPSFGYIDQSDDSHNNSFGAWTNDSFNSAVSADTAALLQDDVLGGYDRTGVTTALPIRTSSDGPAFSQTSIASPFAFGPDDTPVQQHHYIAPGTHGIECKPEVPRNTFHARDTPFGYATQSSSVFDITRPTPSSSIRSRYRAAPRHGPPQFFNQTQLNQTPTVPSQHEDLPPFLTQYNTAVAFSRNITYPDSQPPKPLIPIAPSPATVMEQPQPSQPPPSKGGRRKGQPLSQASRLQSSAMRKRTACWRCALQRDSCDQGAPCKRCIQKFSKGQLQHFGCERVKLGELVSEFLPPSMTIMHQKQSIEDTIKEQVIAWDEDDPLDVYLCSGYGPPLRWQLHEFKPRTTDLLGQFQYLQNRQTGEQERLHKYSPPFGIMKLDSSNDVQIENYLNSLLEQDVLWDFGWTFYEEESQVDEDQFQARLLDQMCRLYIQTEDHELGLVLQQVIKMLIITYIMGHTLTIAEETLPSVINHIKHTHRYPTSPFTSPRLANRQLKLYFGMFRKQYYENVLNWQQQILHSSGKKENSWLASFCAVLGFGMVLEEVQRTLFIQMDAKITKKELPLNQAIFEAQNACERIDEKYKLLVGLFQVKYRDKRWGADGSFGSSTPRYSDLPANEFLANVRELLVKKRDFLKARMDVKFARETQCLYTSRLVARFLLPFLDLP